MLYKVKLPEDFPYEPRVILGLGEFFRGQERQLELSPEQAKALEAKGFVISPATKEKKEVRHGVSAK